MLEKTLKALFAASVFAALPLTVSQLAAQDSDRADAVEYHLIDRMRSGRVFHDRSYPDPDTNGQYYCPKCVQQRQYSEAPRRTARRYR